MRIRSLTTKSLAAGLALAIGIPTVAMAAHPFDDVPDGEWFSEAVEWAYDNNLTTGKTPTTFNGWDTMNRYEGVTLFSRYNTEIVEPMMNALEHKLDQAVEMEFDMFGFDRHDGALSATVGAPTNIPVSTSVTIPDGYKGVIEVELAGESNCTGGAAILITGWCKVGLYVDGDEITFSDQAFDSSDNGTEGIGSWEGHTARAVTDELPAGTYDVTAVMEAFVTDASFGLQDVTLTAEVHLTDDDSLDFIPVHP